MVEESIHDIWCVGVASHFHGDVYVISKYQQVYLSSEQAVVVAAIKIKDARQIQEVHRSDLQEEWWHGDKKGTDLLYKFYFFFMCFVFWWWLRLNESVYECGIKNWGDSNLFSYYPPAFEAIWFRPWKIINWFVRVTPLTFFCSGCVCVPLKVLISFGLSARLL